VVADQANDRFTLLVEVESTTANGTADILVSGVKDKAGNVAPDLTDIFEINKNQITGSVELEGLADISRAVTFVSTGTGDSKTWTPTLSFTGSVASYTLDNVPENTTHLSAKAAWNLREKLDVTDLGNGQGTANFVSDGTGGWNDASDHYLRGGDLNGSNGINILDYSVLKINWYTTNAVADINGDGNVQLLDYIILKGNFFQKGDDE
jgi:hypothetical protein